MTKIPMRKDMGGLYPIDDRGVDLLAPFPLGEVIQVSISRPRNLAHHNKFYALCNKVAENTDMVADADELVFRLKIATGHCRRLVRSNGEVLYEPRSINFASMDQTAFDAFYKQCLNIICTRIIPGMEREELQAEVLEMVA